LNERIRWYGLAYPSIAIPQSVYWDYRPSPGAPRGYMADLTHYYAAVAAGLGEIGWHNLALTPEFGPRRAWLRKPTTGARWT
jgi:hypothetical protein